MFKFTDVTALHVYARRRNIFAFFSVFVFWGFKHPVPQNRVLGMSEICSQSNLQNAALISDYECMLGTKILH